MKHLPTILFLLIISSSCIPLRIAPSIKEDKVMVAKKFKRKLPKHYAFIFEDPKDAGEFYNYVNIKYDLNHVNVQNIPFIMDKETYHFCFYETEIPSKSINLIPSIAHKALENNGLPTLGIDDDIKFHRFGNWYLVLTVLDNDMNDALHPHYKPRNEIIKFLKDLRMEYLNTHNYYEAMLKK